eukprot:Nk52_evm1s2351 gene=Nk52_evmTU1s2351
MDYVLPGKLGGKYIERTFRNAREVSGSNVYSISETQFEESVCNERMHIISSSSTADGNMLYSERERMSNEDLKRAAQCA